MVAAGPRFWLAPTRLPGFQVYVLAPEAVTFTLVPAQMLGDAGENVSVGSGLTFTVTIPGAAAIQPRELVPVTEYTVAIVGQTTGPPFK